ncbi:MAG: complex I NDUFA9 subunit family protein [Alphaproteobacteria bacterium]
MQEKGGFSGKTATVFGGTGFLGRHIVRKLARLGVRIRVVTRVPERAYFLKPFGDVGQIVPVRCDYTDLLSVAAVIRGSDFVINCVGILYEKRKKSVFQRAHVDLPAMIARICAEEGVKRFVHVSALGCSAGISRYARSKLAGEQVVLSNYPKVTLLRPSVMFGCDDNFFNMFASLSRYMPFLPLIGGGKTKLQPVYVADVADAAIEAVCLTSDQYTGRTYQLGGPEVMDFRDIYALVFSCTGRKKRLVYLPFKLAKYCAWFMEWMPRPLLTRDQVNSLRTDSVVQEGALGFSSFGIIPKSVRIVSPQYLERYKQGGGSIPGHEFVPAPQN